MSESQANILFGLGFGLIATGFFLRNSDPKGGNSLIGLGGVAVTATRCLKKGNCQPVQI